MNWIQSSNYGWINLDHASRIEWRDKTAHVFGPGLEGGARLYPETYHGDLWRRLCCQIIPAAPGHFAVVIYVSSEGDDVWEVRMPVVAWQIDTERVSRGLVDACYPLVAGEVASNSEVLLELPDGSLERRGMCSYRNIEEAKAAMLAEHTGNSEVEAKSLANGGAAALD
jgi:hypothetical protein